ncbi:hypothetical protein B0I37DRAFT_378925 [Chaetomium sp. MPI-CAGE-AT-0009]|nr:hypothetical protein B0I37DRAFT_378925 [Chaetomium sp. MPI-CAGE-AT-0009]
MPLCVCVCVCVSPHSFSLGISKSANITTFLSSHHCPLQPGGPEHLIRYHSTLTPLAHQRFPVFLRCRHTIGPRRRVRDQIQTGWGVVRCLNLARARVCEQGLSRQRRLGLGFWDRGGVPNHTNGLKGVCVGGPSFHKVRTFPGGTVQKEVGWISQARREEWA